MIATRFVRFIAPLLLLLPISTSTKAIEVVTTIKPLQLIAAAVMDGVDEPELLLPTSASPHDYQLRPSDVRTIQKADLLFWVGPELEAFLVKSLQESGDHTQTIGLLAHLESHLEKQGDDHDDHDHQSEEHHDEHDDHGSAKDHDDHSDHHDHKAEEHHDEHHDHQAEKDHDNHVDHHGHDHGGLDPHIWLSPKFAKLIATEMMEALVNKDSANADQYRANFGRFEEKLNALNSRLNTQLAPVKDRGYYVFHDAYGHFEDYYQLNHLGAFTVDPERRPGARHLVEIRNKLERSEATCIFAEPQFKPTIITTITDGMKVNHGTLDPLASDFKANANGYLDFLQWMGDQFQRCLSKSIK